MPHVSPREEALREITARLGRENVLVHPADRLVYECDGYTLVKCMPQAVVFPRSTRDVQQVVRICREYRVPLVARGAGTGLAGGATPTDEAIVVSLARMNRILAVDLVNRRIRVEAGVINLELSQHLAGTGYQFAPDPSSQVACTLGGNIATNAGGPHTLKYGVTVNHVLGLECVTGEGEVLELEPRSDPGDLDWIGVLTGSEGTLAIVTSAWLKLIPAYREFITLRGTFSRIEDACRAVSRIIGAGITPAAMELMDQGILQAVEEAFHFGFPTDVEAVLIVELDGVGPAIEAQAEQVATFCRECGAREVLSASDAAERARLWQCRKSAVGAVGRLSPAYFIQDGVVPRTKLPEVATRVKEIARRWNVRVVNVAHAGDGNIHPIFLYDPKNPAEVERTVSASHEILAACIHLGGSITAEHGVGLEKRDFMERLYPPEVLEAMRALKRVFDPDAILSPGKVIPSNGEEHSAVAKGENNA